MKIHFRRSVLLAASVLALQSSIWANDPTCRGRACKDLKEAATGPEGTNLAVDGNPDPAAKAGGPAVVATGPAKKGPPEAPSDVKPGKVKGPDSATVPDLTDKHRVDPDPEPSFLSKVAKSPMTWIFGGALVGGLIGALAFGPMGFLLGGMIGVGAGYFGHMFLGS